MIRAIWQTTKLTVIPQKKLRKFSLYAWRNLTIKDLFIAELIFTVSVNKMELNKKSTTQDYNDKIVIILINKQDSCQAWKTKFFITTKNEETNLF